MGKLILVDVMPGIRRFDLYPPAVGVIPGVSVVRVDTDPRGTVFTGATVSGHSAPGYDPVERLNELAGPLYSGQDGSALRVFDGYDLYMTRTIAEALATVRGRMADA